MNAAMARADRALVLALAVILATASAAVGTAITYRPAAPVSRAIARPAPISPPQQIAWDVPTVDLLADHRCLTEALYYEARGEGKSGQQAVAEVVFHRLNTGRYGRSICAVVYEGAAHPGCQFSFTCDGAIRHPRDPSAWSAAEELAEQILIGAVRLDNVTGSATNYHALTVSPYWAPTLKETAQIGNHIFYRNRPRYRLANRDQTDSKQDEHTAGFE